MTERGFKKLAKRTRIWVASSSRKAKNLKRNLRISILRRDRVTCSSKMQRNLMVGSSKSMLTWRRRIWSATSKKERSSSSNQTVLYLKTVLIRKRRQEMTWKNGSSGFLTKTKSMSPTTPSLRRRIETQMRSWDPEVRCKLRLRWHEGKIWISKESEEQIHDKDAWFGGWLGSSLK